MRSSGTDFSCHGGSSRCLHGEPFCMASSTMMDVWKEMKQREEFHESERLTKSSGTLFEMPTTFQPMTDAGLLDTGFALRTIWPATTKLWLAVQVVGLLFQAALWHEITCNSAEFEETVSKQCAGDRTRHGVCIGPTWNLSTWLELVLHGSSRHRDFGFATTSSPPTFLVVVDPVSRTDQEGNTSPDPSPHVEQPEPVNAPWALHVTRVNPPLPGSVQKQNGDLSIQQLHAYQRGQQAMTFEDLSIEAQQSVTQRGRVDWRATLFCRECQSQETNNVKYVTFVQDAKTAHLSAIHSSSQCAFGNSWKAFNMQRQGHDHRVVSWCRSLLGIFLFVGSAVVFVVHKECNTLTAHGSKFRFHNHVIAKFLVQDIPQQICIVLYLFGWYESNGLRCQLCLFHPEHCKDARPFHMANTVAITCTLLSSVSNQLLIRPVRKKTYVEHEICLQWCVRIGGVCVSTLPFTTGICLASKNLFVAPMVFHSAFTVSCGVGWLTLVGLVCIPLLSFCADATAAERICGREM